ncbi:MAG: LOG family protein [Alphaproteobacteria bacterium]
MVRRAHLTEGISARGIETVDEDLTDSGSLSRLLALEDAALESDEMRPLRLAREFSKADATLTERQISSTIVVFGGHLIVSPEDADAALARAEGPEQRARALRMKELSAWYAEARLFARIVSERGGALATDAPRENVITTGGGPGIMEAANRGAMDAGAPSIGFNIDLPEEQPPNPYTTPEYSFSFRYFAVRKMHFAIRANALAIFPGGFGTMDELFEILTLKQTRKTAPIPVILFSRDYWRTVVNVEALVDWGTIAPSDADLFEMVDTAEEGWAALVRHGLIQAPPAKDV